MHGAYYISSKNKVFMISNDTNKFSDSTESYNHDEDAEEKYSQSVCAFVWVCTRVCVLYLEKKPDLSLGPIHNGAKIFIAPISSLLRKLLKYEKT